MGRRPSDGVTGFPVGHRVRPTSSSQDLILPSAEILVPGVLVQDTADWTSRIQFWDGDQGVVRRSWSPVPRVTIKKIWAMKPAFEIQGDSLAGGELHMISGRFFEDIGNANDLVKQPSIEFRKSGVTDTFLTTSSSSDERIYDFSRTGQYASAPIPVSVILAELQSALTNPVKDRLATWMTTHAVGLGNSLAAAALGYSSISAGGARWQNTKFVANKGSAVRDSIAAKALIGWQEVNANTAPAVKIYLEFKGFYEWNLTGCVDNGILETP